MQSPLCGIPVYVEPKVVAVAMGYAVVFATTTWALAIRSYIHIFRGLRNTSLPAVISVGVVLMWYTLDTAYWVAPLASGIHLHLRTPANATMGGLGGSAAPKSVSGLDRREASLAPELMCATPGFLAISILAGEAILWWRVCVVWAGNKAAYTVCAISLFVTVVFVAVTVGRLEIMKSPPTRLAVMLFVEPDGIGTAVSVFVSDLVVFMLLGIRKRTRGGSARRTNPGWREHKGAKRTIIQTLGNLALWSLVVVTTLGTCWVIRVAAHRHQVWKTLRNDAPTWSFWNFTLFVAIASSLRMPALVWLLPQSFAHSSPEASDIRALSNDPEGTLDRLMTDDSEHEYECHIELQECGGSNDGGVGYSQLLDHQVRTIQ